jgi:hypothetical protein
VRITWDRQQCALAASDDLILHCFLGQEVIRERLVGVLRPLGPTKYVIAFYNRSITFHEGASKIWDLTAGGLQVIDYSGGGTRDIVFALRMYDILAVDSTGRGLTTRRQPGEPFLRPDR